MPRTSDKAGKKLRPPAKAPYRPVSNTSADTRPEKSRAEKDLLRAKEALAAANAWQRAILDSAGRSIIATDPQGVIQTFNRTAERMLGYRADEVIGKTHPMAIYDADEVERRAIELSRELGRTIEPGFEVFVAKARLGETEERDWTYRRRGGERFPVRLTVTAVFDAKGLLSGFMGIATDITQRRQAEAQLRQQASLLDLSTEAIFTWLGDGPITYWSAGAAALYGYTAEEAIGRHSNELLQTKADMALPALLDALQRDGSWSGDLTHRTKKGKILSIESSMVMPLMDGRRLVLEINRDVTKRKQAEAALQESERRLGDLFDNTSDLIQSVSPDGKFLFVNAAWHRALGYSRADLDKLNVFDIIAPESFEHCREMFGKVMSGTRIESLDVRFRTKDGDTLELEGNASCQLKDGRPVATRAIFHDVTERQQREAATQALNEALARQTAELTIAKSRAEAADRLKSAFLATMSHELRTPLNSILGFTGIILQGLAGPLNPEQSKQLGMVQGSARHLLALINDVLDISKIEAGELEVTHSAFDLRTSITKVIGIVTPLAEQKSLALRVEVSPEVGQVVSDARRVEQVLLNLVNNAIKFTESGEVALTAVQRADCLVLSVTDTGIGIKPADVQALFQPFRQIDTGLGRNHEGTGLGLAICRRLAGLMGGEISVESESGKGSTFSFTLPLDKAKSA